MAVVLQQNKSFLLYEQTISYKYDILHVILYLQQIAGIIKHAIMQWHDMAKCHTNGKHMADMNKSLSIIGWRDAVLARLEARWPEME